MILPSAAPWSGAAQHLQTPESNGSQCHPRGQHLPSTGGGAMPALGAMQEPIPDFSLVLLPFGTDPYFLANQQIGPYVYMVNLELGQTPLGMSLISD